MKSFQQLLDLLKNSSHKYSPKDQGTKTLTPYQQILRTIGIMVLGEIEGTKEISCFSVNCSKPFSIPRIERYRIENLIQDCGSESKDHIYTGRDETPPGKFLMQEIREAIAAEASHKQTSGKERLGAGVWEINGRLVPVGYRQIAVFNGAWEVSHVPHLDGSAFDFSGNVGHWFDSE